MKNVFYFSKKVRLFSQNDVLFLFYFLINPAGTTVIVVQIKGEFKFIELGHAKDTQRCCSRYSL